jgi:hypothetical protein
MKDESSRVRARCLFALKVCDACPEFGEMAINET